MESKNERMNECVRRPRIIIKLHKLELPNPPRKITMIEKKNRKNRTTLETNRDKTTQTVWITFFKLKI